MPPADPGGALPALADLVSLAGRVAVVTGGAQGIGAAIAARLAEAGARVVVGDLATEVPVDVADAASVAGLAERAVAEHGSLDIWVNNAGVYPAKRAVDVADDAWDRVLDVNLRGAFVGAREAARRMIDAGRGGVIVNVTSTAAHRATPGFAPYTASKYGLRGLTQALAAELGPHGIRVVAVAPTVCSTPGLGDLDVDTAEFAARLPLRRVASPDDVARVVLFCASDLAALVTGSTVAVDAGELAV
jgi:NAD(P)-dependent dehydrogenase (short-subunit alcohol dehydrogenase family)